AAALDITTPGDVPYVALRVGGLTSLYTIDPATGRASAIGRIGAGGYQITGLATASSARLAPASATATAAANARAFQIPVRRTAGTETRVTVDFGTADGTAVAGQDYLATRGTLVFMPGETSKTITVPILNDTLVDGPETLTLSLSNPTGGAIL